MKSTQTSGVETHCMRLGYDAHLISATSPQMTFSLTTFLTFLFFPDPFFDFSLTLFKLNITLPQYPQKSYSSNIIC